MPLADFNPTDFNSKLIRGINHIMSSETNITQPKACTDKSAEVSPIEVKKYRIRHDAPVPTKPTIKPTTPGSIFKANQTRIGC